MVTFQDILVFELWNNSGRDYAIAIAIFFLSFLVLKIFEKYLIRVFKRAAKKSKTELDDILFESLDTIRPPFYTFIALYIASRFLTLSNAVNRGLFFVLIIAVVYYAVGFVSKIVDHITDRQIKKRKDVDKRDDVSVIKNLGNIAKGALWLIAIMIVLANMGIDITPLIAGLGVGGIAIAFALQNILEDLFSSFSIYFDKPFKEGDFIIVGSDMGTVKHIGIKTTRITTLQGQELVVSNRELTSSRVNNYKRMDKRRIVFSFGVTYNTPLKKLNKIKGIVKKIIDDVELADIDRVHFKEFADSSLNYEVVYLMKTSDYNKYMDVQEEINLKLVEAFEKEKIEFAFPTRTIYLEK